LRARIQSTSIKHFSYTTSPEAVIELYISGNTLPSYKEELSVLRYFRIENLKRQDYILKVIPTGQNAYKYNASVTQLNLKTDTDQLLARLNEKQLNLTLHKLEKKTAVKSR
jgi:hypothetical protein